MQTINIVTLGCSKNTVDSEWLGGSLRKAGYTVFFDDHSRFHETVLINTCGFIGDAKEESIDTIFEFAEAKKQGKIKKIIVFGCLAERYKMELATEIPTVDAFFGVHEWNKILTMLQAHPLFPNYMERRISTPSHYAYLKIAEGCDRHCSFCAIPNIRGHYQSRPIENIIEEAHLLTENGVKELLLIAQDTTYYGLDLYKERRLAQLLHRLAQEVKPEWIRLHYTYPNSFQHEMMEAIASHDNICNYIDIPLQHVSSTILKSMNRHIDKKGTYKIVEEIRRAIPDVALRTTLIVGYPHETEDDFAELKTFIQDIGFDRLGVFTYSAEEDTPAFALPDNVPEELKQERADELMAIQQTISLEKNKQKVGKTLRTLIDRKEGEYSIGRTEYDSPEVDNEVLIADTSLEIGRFYPVNIRSTLEFDLEGEIDGEMD